MEDRYKQLVLWMCLAFLGVALYYAFSSAPNDGTAALVFTAIIVIWYSYETYRLRETTQTTLEIEQTPKLVLSISHNSLSLLNIGKQTAYDIEFHPFSVGAFNCLYYLDTEKDFLGSTTADTAGVILNDLVWRDDRSKHRFPQIFTEMQRLQAQALILFHFSNGAGERYFQVYVLSSKSALGFDPLLEYISSGKGEITYARAQVAVRKNSPKKQRDVVLEEFIATKLNALAEKS